MINMIMIIYIYMMFDFVDFHFRLFVIGHMLVMLVLQNYPKRSRFKPSPDPKTQNMFSSIHVGKINKFLEVRSPTLTFR